MYKSQFIVQDLQSSNQTPPTDEGVQRNIEAGDFDWLGNIKCRAKGMCLSRPSIHHVFVKSSCGNWQSRSDTTMTTFGRALSDTTTKRDDGRTKLYCMKPRHICKMPRDVCNAPWKFFVQSPPHQPFCYRSSSPSVRGTKKILLCVSMH